MKSYIFVTSMKEEKLEAIKRDFEKVFGINLDNEKYESFNHIEGKWRAVIKDSFIYQTENREEFYGNNFWQLLEELAYCEKDILVKPQETVEKERIKLIKRLKFYVDKYCHLFEEYYMYEADVWLNAYLSALFIKARREDRREGNGKKEDGLKFMEIESEGAWGSVKCKSWTYKIPFRNYQNGFCKAYSEKLLNKDVIQVLDIQNEDLKEYKEDCSDPNFRGYKKKIRLEFETDKKYGRWSRDKILELERDKSFQLEDKIMFHKTVNGLLVRNLVDAMISLQIPSDVEDYLYLLDKLCTLKSIRGQNLIGCMYIMMNRYRLLLIEDGMWDDVQLMFETWLSRIYVANRRLEILVGGLFYFIVKQDSRLKDLDEIQKKCEALLCDIESPPIPFTEELKVLIQKEWEQPQGKYRMTKKEKERRQYFWIYAIMQRRTIRGLAPQIYKRRLWNEINWSQFIYRVTNWFRMFREFGSIQEREKYKKFFSICENLVNDGKTTKEDLCQALKKEVNNLEETEKYLYRIYREYDWTEILIRK